MLLRNNKKVLSLLNTTPLGLLFHDCDVLMYLIFLIVRQSTLAFYWRKKLCLVNPGLKITYMERGLNNNIFIISTHQLFAFHTHSPEYHTELLMQERQLMLCVKI